MNKPEFFVTLGYGGRQLKMFHYSQAAKVGDRVETSGQGRWDDDWHFPETLADDMDQQRWEQIKVLLDSAVELRPERRSGFLAEACANDQSLRAEVEGLLMHYEQAEEFLEGNPGADLYASIQSKADEPAFSSGQIIAGRFRIIDLIGWGGMGEVYKAEDMRLRRIVALKFLPDDTARYSHALERFQLEAQDRLCPEPSQYLEGLNVV